MTRDEIIRMALEAGFLKHADALYTNHRFGDCIGELERFAALVAAAEREACAQIAFDADHMGSVNLKLMKNRIGNAIRARSNP